jgi:nicotinate-nucleotide pyrophosphorylase (carboxylating)
VTRPTATTPPTDPAHSDPPPVAVAEAVARAIAEDVLPLGDLTASLISEEATTAVEIVSRGGGVVAGRACALEALRQVDPTIRSDWVIGDGGGVRAGDVAARVSGSLRSILTAERTVLNFLGHLSGVATLTRRYVDCVAAANAAARVLDTRKTTPGLRALEKAAVRAGGGYNHRGSLSDGVLVKDNHLGSITITEAVGRARRLWPGRMVEVECDRIEQVGEAVAAGATVIMLDNMGPDDVAACAVEVHAAGLLVEVSGGVTLETAPRLAAAGADLISVGALTHSAPVLDLGFDLLAGAGREG